MEEEKKPLKISLFQFVFLLFFTIVLIICCCVFVNLNSRLKRVEEINNNEENLIISGQLNNSSNNEDAKNEIRDEDDNETNKLSQHNELLPNEENTVEEYLRLLLNCDHSIEVFDDINKAEKSWIYSQVASHSYRFKDESNISEYEIEELLKEIFGDKLIIDVKSDIENGKEEKIYYPGYDENKDSYWLRGYGVEIYIQYVIDEVIEKDNTITVTVYEYIVDLAGDEDNPNTDDPFSKRAIYSTLESYNKKKLKTIDSDLIEDTFKYDNPSKIIEKEVLKMKDKFQAYTLTINKTEDGRFVVESISKK